MSTRPRWTKRLADVPGFPAELVGPLASARIVTIADLITRVRHQNPGLIPPPFALGLHVRINSYPLTDPKPAHVAGEVLAAFLGLTEYQRPADWTDPASHPPEPTMPKPRTLPTASLSLHPEAHLVPAMPADQYARFLADVKARGVLEPIELVPGTRTVIEGRTRLKAATEAGLHAVPVVDADLKDDPPVLYMLRAALLRRHLTKGQAAALAVEMESQLAAAAKERQRHHGGTAPGRKKTLPEIVPGVNGEARVQAAAAAGVNPRYVSDAKKVKAKSPEVYEQVMAGTVTLPEATRAVKRVTASHRGAKAPLHDATDPESTTRAGLDGCRASLRPCPFCGSAELKVLIGTYRIIQCLGCFACGPRKSVGDVEQCRDAWNQRREIIG